MALRLGVRQEGLIALAAVLVAALTAACTTPRALDPIPEAASAPAFPASGVELIVRNDTERLVWVFTRWEGGARRELGQVAERTTRWFSTELRGQSLRLEFRHTRRQGGEFLRVEHGDRLEWTLHAAGGVYVRRLDG